MSAHTYSPELMAARGMGIILVTLGHSEPVGEVYPAFKDWIYTFHMPLFFVMAGFFSLGFCAIADLRAWRAEAGRRLLPLLLPYVVISCSYFLVKAAMPALVKRPVELSGFLVDLFCYPLHNPAMFLWFIHTLILVKALCPLMRLAPPWIMLPLLAVLHLQEAMFPEVQVQLFGIALVCKFALFFYLGLLLAPHRERVFALLASPAALVLAGLAFAAASWLLPRMPAASAWRSLVLLAASLSGSATVICLCFQLPRTQRLAPVGRILEYLGRHSLDIYMLQYYFIFAILLVLGRLGVDARYIVPATFAIGLAGPLAAVHLVFTRYPVLRRITVGR